MLRSLLALCGCCLFLLILSLFVKYLDQRDGFFSLLFNVFSLLRVQEFKSFVFVYFFFVLIFPPSTLSLFLCYFCFNLSGCLFSLKLTC